MMISLTTHRWWPILRWMPLLICMGVIFWFSNQPGNAITNFGPWDLFIKKGAHMVGYGGLAIAAYIATGRYWLAWLIAVLYAFSDEYHQTFIPGRNGTLDDVLIDAFGAAVGLLSVWLVWGRKGGSE